ncbi:MAG: c-type cytochrome [Bauldia sp.]|nr:c-type cytochrome [Bauldia sp.]
MNGFRALGGAFAALCLIGTAGIASAQDANFGRSVWLSQANCADCHGWLGDGINEDPRSPKGADLRVTVLDAAQLAEVILCGRPGTGMPHFDPRAYTDDRCYGLTAAAIGDAIPPAGAQELTARHARGLAAFILAEFVGKGAPTRQECVALLGPDSQTCNKYPSAP